MGPGKAKSERSPSHTFQILINNSKLFTISSPQCFTVDHCGTCNASETQSFDLKANSHLTRVPSKIFVLLTILRIPKTLEMENEICDTGDILFFQANTVTSRS